MSKNFYILGIISVLVLGGGIWWYTMFNTYVPNEYMVETPSNTAGEVTGTSTTTATTTTVNATTGEVNPGAKSYTMSEVATHKDATSCYSVINGIVYDLTLWINVHPGGGGRILSLCGIDGTNNFMNKHHGAAKFMTILSRFKIGILVQ